MNLAGIPWVHTNTPMGYGMLKDYEDPNGTVCPRCKRILNTALFFQLPVRICMVCYGSVPGNELIREDLQALKEKAKRSRAARREEHHSDLESRLRTIAGSIKAQPSSKLALPTSAFLEKCERCEKEVPDLDVTTKYRVAEVAKKTGSDPDLPSIICRECCRELGLLFTT